MTESEAKAKLERTKVLWDGAKTEIVEAVRVAIQALEEVEQYRAIGTVEELKSMKENGSFSGVELAQIAVQLNELKEYKKIGTIERFREMTEQNSRIIEALRTYRFLDECLEKITEIVGIHS